VERVRPDPARAVRGSEGWFWRYALELVLIASCGDAKLPPGQPLASAPDLTIVAHQDDDLLFMQPDVADLAARHGGLTSVYVTAGNGKHGLGVAERRYRGLMEAYRYAAHADGVWRCGSIAIAGHAAEHCRLAEANISLVFLGYPDGGKEGEAEDSLLRLWSGRIDSAETIAREHARYDRDGLITTVAEVIAQTAPRTIRTLEVSATHGRDHSDHMVVGALAVLAATHAGYEHELLAFRGYANESEPENVVGARYRGAYEMLARYHACVSGCGVCGGACASIDKAHDVWVRRRYAVGRRPTPAAGRLRIGDRCATLRSDGAVGLGDCASAPAWQLAAAGSLRVGSHCIETLASGELVAREHCTADGANRFVFDDEGHLWSGRPPDPAKVVAGAHAPCVGVAAERLTAQPCGAGRAPTWELATLDVAVSPRPTWLPDHGRAARLASRQLCVVRDGQLACAAMTSSPPGIGPAEHRGPLPIEPESLALASQRGRSFGGHDDQATPAPIACGRTPTGILCVAAGSPPALWTAAFARDGAATASDRALAWFEDQICGVTDTAIACARADSLDVRSRWPVRDTAVWFGDLDGDGDVDWCSTTAAGASCGRGADRALSDEGFPWTFHLGGVAEPTPIDPALGALTDIDGDGLADLCTVHDRRVRCARSQRYGFGPAVVLASLPPGAAPRALWMSGAAGCVDDGVSLICFAPAH
jgi:LmbE family N-acetylglucosaminyl deacetylase